jgi:hypothetical protein
VTSQRFDFEKPATKTITISQHNKQVNKAKGTESRIVEGKKGESNHHQVRQRKLRKKKERKKERNRTQEKKKKGEEKKKKGEGQLTQHYAENPKVSSSS